MFIISTLPIFTTAQVVNVTGKIFDEITDHVSDMPDEGLNNYVPPTALQLNSWGQVLHNLIHGNYNTAADTASILNYSVTLFTDTTKTPNRNYYMLKNVGTNYWGTYIYNPNHCRPLVIQSPHAKYEKNVGKQGIHIFHETEAAFFMMNGAHRCNRPEPSDCDGETKVCSGGADEPYKISDVCHTTSNVFQSTTDTLFRTFGNSHFLQLHGFGKLASDPFIVLSNGTLQTPVSDIIATLRTNLIAEDPVFFTDSIKVAHLDLDWERLRGTNNKQGRLINSSVDVCSVDATSTNGRFIHMEQERTKLRDDITGWNKVSNAVNATFPSCVVLPITLLDFKLDIITDKSVVCEWSTASEINNNYFTIERSSNALDWLEIGKVEAAGNSSKIIEYRYIDNNPNIGTSYYRLKQTDFDGKYTYSEIKSIKSNNNNNQVRIYPNPFENQIIIEASKEELEYIRVHNILGQNIMKQLIIIKNSDINITLDLSKLNSGIYFIQTKTTINKAYKQ